MQRTCQETKTFKIEKNYRDVKRKCKNVDHKKREN